MATLVTKFSEFLKDIRPTQGQRDDMKQGHTALRNRLREFEDIQDILVSDFLQGSYRRSTAIRPAEGCRSDVDIVVVTNLPRPEDDPEDGVLPADALARFEPFVEKYYKGKWRPQGRSIGIELSYVDLDLVITSKPASEDVEAYESAAALSSVGLEEDPDWWLSSAWVPTEERDQQIIAAAASSDNEWKTKPLWIPDCDADQWDETHPLAQIQYSRDKNKACERLYLGVVKCIKWWQRLRSEVMPKPKGYPLEHLVGLHCPVGIASHAEGVTLTLEAIRDVYALYPLTGQKPELPDHGVPTHDVLARVTAEEFKAFHAAISEAAGIARDALDEVDEDKSAARWQELFGSRFPSPPAAKATGGFTPPTEPARPKPTRYA